MRRLLIIANLAAPVAFGCLWAAGHCRAGLAAMMVVHALTLWATLYPYCRWWGPQQGRFPAAADEVCLTLDDGPDPIDTPVILEALAAHRARAVFFLIGEKAARYPEWARAIADAGHVVANHTATHPQYRFWALGPGRLAEEIDGGAARIATALGDRPLAPLFRAPAGMRNVFLHPLLKKRGLSLASWSARGLDGRDTDRVRIVRRVVDGVEPGAILLLHEGMRDAAGRSLAVDTVPAVLAGIARRGYNCVIPPGWHPVPAESSIP